MATQPPCDKDVFKNGKCLLITNGIPAAVIERWVRAIAADSGQKVDWHYAAGRAIILVLGDFEKARDSMTFLWPVHTAELLKASGIETPGPG